MMTITNHEETIGYFDNAIISEILDTGKEQFSLYREYIGGVDEESGLFDLEGACGCIISLNEIDTADHQTIDKLNEAFSSLGWDIRTEEDVVMMTAPEIKKSLVIECYSSESETIDICNTIKAHLEQEG